MGMTIGDGVAFGGLALAFFGFVYKVSSGEEAKRKRVFERMDEIKKDTDAKIEKSEDKLVKKELCVVVHAEIKEDLGDIKKIVACIPKIKANLDLLLQNNGIHPKDD
jgi:hypothetical protein